MITRCILHLRPYTRITRWMLGLHAGDIKTTQHHRQAMWSKSATLWHEGINVEMAALKTKRNVKENFAVVGLSIDVFIWCEALYGLRQTGRELITELNSWFVGYGFKQCETESYLYSMIAMAYLHNQASLCWRHFCVRKNLNFEKKMSERPK